jgi:7-cyano-7-deazaguanine synthase in queuosine biosynthesis
MVEPIRSEFPFSYVVCLMSGGLDSTAAAILVAKASSVVIQPLYIRRGASAEKHELNALSFILDWLNSRFPGRFAKIKQISMSYPPAELKSQYSSKHRDAIGYVGRELVIASCAAFFTLTNQPPNSVAAIVDGSLTNDLFTHNTSRYFELLQELFRVECGAASPFFFHPLQGGFELGAVGKKEVVSFLMEMDFPLEITRSCVASTAVPCGYCPECQQREEAISAICDKVC